MEMFPHVGSMFSITCKITCFFLLNFHCTCQLAFLDQWFNICSWFAGCITGTPHFSIITHIVGEMTLGHVVTLSLGQVITLSYYSGAASSYLWGESCKL